MSNLLPTIPNSILQYKKVPISSADILSLNSTPKELISAPGAGKAVIIQNSVTVYNYGGVSYVAAGNLNFVQGANNLIQLGTFLTLGASSIRQTMPTSVVITENTNVVATVTSSDPTTGNGTLDVHIWYYIVTF